MEGDDSAGSDFRGLNNHDHLSKYEWSLELWVLPQIEGCTTLVKWNDVPQLRAQDFCDWKAAQKDEGKLGIVVLQDVWETLLTQDVISE